MPIYISYMRALWYWSKIIFSYRANVRPLSSARKMLDISQFTLSYESIWVTEPNSCILSYPCAVAAAAQRIVRCSFVLFKQD